MQLRDWRQVGNKYCGWHYREMLCVRLQHQHMGARSGRPPYVLWTTCTLACRTLQGRQPLQRLRASVLLRR